MSGKLSDVESLLKRGLGCSTVKHFGSGGGGCVSWGEPYETDNYGKVFAKMNSRSVARGMFDGEMTGLQAILATNTVKVPKPYKVLDHDDGGAVLVAEYIHMQPGRLSCHGAKLGELVAKMHLHNEELRRKQQKQTNRVGSDETSYVSKFGFHTETYMGYIPQPVTWEDDWVNFFARHRLKPMFDLFEREIGNREVMDLWSELQLKVPEFFIGLDVKPALLHGDLCRGNVRETEHEPVSFDPVCYYGHHEYDLATADTFGGVGSDFHAGYHNCIPKAPGFEKRRELYKVFYYVMSWYHGMDECREDALANMRALLT